MLKTNIQLTLSKFIILDNDYNNNNDNNNKNNNNNNNNNDNNDNNNDNNNNNNKRPSYIESQNKSSLLYSKTLFDVFLFSYHRLFKFNKCPL